MSFFVFETSKRKKPEKKKKPKQKKKRKKRKRTSGALVSSSITCSLCTRLATSRAKITEKVSSGEAVARACPTRPPIEALRAAAAAAFASRGEVPKTSADEDAVGVPNEEDEGVKPDEEPRPPKLPTGVALPLFPPLPPPPLPPLRATPQNSLPLAFARASPTGSASEPRCSQTRARRSGTAKEPIIAPIAAASLLLLLLLLFSAEVEVEELEATLFSTTASPATPAFRIAASASIAGAVGGTVTTLPSAQPVCGGRRKEEREIIGKEIEKRERDRERDRERERERGGGLEREKKRKERRKGKKNCKEKKTTRTETHRAPPPS